MKSYVCLTVFFALFLAQPSGGARAESSGPSLIYETPREFFGMGEFNGDGRPDLVIVDKETGKYRLGYAAAEGRFNWVDCRQSGIKGVSGFALGKLIATNVDALAFTSPDANQITLADVSSPVAPIKPVMVPFSAALGPNLIVALDIGGEGNTSLADLYVASIYNSPDPNLATLLRNDAAEYPKLGEAILPGQAGRGNHLALKSGGADLLCELITSEKGNVFEVEGFAGGKASTVATVSGLPAGTEYTAGNFRKSALRDFVFYQPGQNNLQVRAAEEGPAGQFKFAEPRSFELAEKVRRVVSVDQPGGQRLLVIFGEGEKAGVFNFDGEKAPALVQMLYATNVLFTCGAAAQGGLVLFAQPPEGKFSTKYYSFQLADGKYVAGVYGSLPTLADNDNITIPDIHARLVAGSKVSGEAEMKTCTNTIPGTRVSFVMVPIRGGEFTMGSPESEAGRNADEGPQHKVKISPFWMGQCEVTWNEYELFMYPDEEKRSRGTYATDAAGDKLADAVTHPSKPYVEMSFGMGKDGYPAISMTQHAANKYCQWLSAKTGQFYRLPTEAEWEYACRAGTTTAYFFGNDPAMLKDYGWFEQNSDFKYQKVGKKKPNPWGLYDMCGNVVEWVLDQYDPEYYRQCGTQAAIDPWNKATKPYPHAVRGGSWDDEEKSLRSAARRGSERAWKMQDPQLPKSIWYFSDAQFVGFRLVRPLQVPPPEQLQKYWTSGVERD